MLFQDDKTQQAQLFGFTPRDLISKDSDVWLYIDFFDNLDLIKFENEYTGVGQVPISPKLILRTIFFGLTHGVISGRKLYDVCRNDNRFIVLSGGLMPDRRTIDRFLIRHKKNIEEVFTQVVRLAIEMDLASLGNVAIDGSRFKANTNIHKSMKYKNMSKAIEHIKKNIRQLRKDLHDENKKEEGIESKLNKGLRSQEDRLAKIKEAKEKIEAEYNNRSKKDNTRKIDDISRSLNDSDALAMSHKSKGKGFIYGHNIQIAVDGENQIILANHVHSKATDYEALPGIVDEVERNCNLKPENVLADLGYKSIKNIRELSNKKIKPLIATGSREDKEIEEQFSEQVKYTGVKHEYTCIRGKKLELHARRKDGRTEFKFNDKFCKGCRYKDKCKGHGRKTITIPAEEHREIMNEYYSDSRKDDFKLLYRKRKAIVEPVFGNMKNKGMKLSVNGKTKVTTWLSLMCTALNIEKIINSIINNNEAIIFSHP